jgi:Asp-tRNA(Asn)/Glu-tRNA(Gln) amidotransferase A subunit family amidase
MAQTLADLRMLADLTLRPAHGDPSCVYGPGSASIDRPVGTVFAASRIAGDRPIDPAVEAAFVAAASAFGRSVERDVQFVSNGILDSTADEVWATIYAPEDVFSVGRDVLLEHYELLDPRITSWVDRGMATTLADYLQARQSRCDHVRKLDELLDVDSVLLCPILTTPAYAIDGRTNNGRDDELMPIDVFNTAALNLTGHPGLTVPAGSLHGIPTGLQIIGPRGSDLWLIEIAKAWERSHPWPLTAPGYDVFSPFAL